MQLTPHQLGATTTSAINSLHCAETLFLALLFAYFLSFSTDKQTRKLYLLILVSPSLSGIYINCLLISHISGLCEMLRKLFLNENSQ